MAGQFVRSFTLENKKFNAALQVLNFERFNISGVRE